jgi:hypothetical protein
MGRGFTIIWRRGSIIAIQKIIRESSIERYLVSEIKQRNGYCIKLLGIVGIPDRLILLPGRIVLFVELKAPKGKLSPLQKWWQKSLTDLGFTCLVIKSKTEVNDLISHYDKVQNI